MPANQGGVYSVLDDDRLNARELFFAGLGEGFDGSWASALGGEPVSSDSEVEMYADLASVPQMALWEGAAPFVELATYRGALRNLDYFSGLLVKKADLRRAKIDRIGQRMGQLGQRAARHWEKLLSDLILVSETDGSSTINSVNDLTTQAYDGQAFFDTDHAFTSGYTTAQDNDVAAGTYSNLNVGTATAPTATEAAAFLPDLFGHFWTLKDSEGEPANGDAMNFVVMVGTNQLFAPITAALGLQTVASGVDSQAFGAVRTLGLNVTVKLNPRLSAKTSQVYVFCTDGIDKPFVLQEEVPIQIAEDSGKEWEPDIRVACWGTRTAGFGNWQRGVLGTLS